MNWELIADIVDIIWPLMVLFLLIKDMDDIKNLEERVSSLEKENNELFFKHRI